MLRDPLSSAAALLESLVMGSRGLRDAPNEKKKRNNVHGPWEDGGSGILWMRRFQLMVIGHASSGSLPHLSGILPI